MPPVAMTSVMPTDTITIVATWVRLTFSVCQVAKFGVTAKLNDEQRHDGRQRRVASQEARDIRQRPPSDNGLRVNHARFRQQKSGRRRAPSRP